MEGLVLVPLDGSATAEHAIPYARRIARLSSAELGLVHVHASPSRPMPSRLLIGPDRAAVHTRKAKLRRADAQYLARIADRISAGLNLVHVSWDVLDGSVEAALLRYIERLTPNLVVMTTRGKGGFARLRVGSVANRVARQAAAPVLLIPPAEHPPHAYSERGFGHILVALDGSGFAEEVLAPTHAIGSFVNASYTLLHVLRPAERAPGPERGDLASEHRVPNERRDAEGYVTRLADRLRRVGAEADPRVVEHPDPAEAILARASEMGASLIALTTVGRGGVARMMLGSVADRVMREADVPVLVTNPNLPQVRARLG